MKVSRQLAILAFVILLTIIGLNSDSLVYDEPYYFENLELIRIHGLGLDFLSNMKGPAGPLHAYFHYLYQFIVQDNVLLIRMLNPILSLGIVWFINRILTIIQAPINNGIHLYLIPMSFITIGLALTEIPALFMFCASLYLLVYATAHEHHRSTIGVLLASGIIFSISVIGRQPYLVCILGMLYILYYSRNKKGIAPIILFSFFALLIPLLCFYLWSGLAPKIGGEIATEKLLSPSHLFIGFGYAAFTMLCICPRFYPRFSNAQLIMHALLCIAAYIVIIASDIQFNYGMISIKKLLPNEYRHLIDPALLAGLIMIGSMFVHAVLIRMIEHKKNIYFIGTSLMLLCLLFSNISITHLFSNRYVFQAAPMFIILSSYYYKPTKLTLAMHILGIILGLRGLIHFI